VAAVRLGSRDSIPGRGKEFSPQYPDPLWDLHGLLSNGYQRLLRPEPHPSAAQLKLYVRSPTLQGMMLNYVLGQLHRRNR
jgi:hypothetical protein